MIQDHDEIHKKNKQMDSSDLPSLLLWEDITSATSGQTRTAPIGIYAEESAWENSF